MFMFGMAVLITFNMSDEIRELFELVPFPNEEFQYTVIYSLCIDLAVCYSIEQLCKRIYLNQFK
jgi:hypothetical protein